MIVAFPTIVATSHYQCVFASTRGRRTLHSKWFAAFPSSLAFTRTGVTLSDRIGELSRISLEASNGSL